MEKLNVPMLRFCSFDDEWTNDEFQNLVKINQGLQIAISDRFTEPVEGSFFYITNEFLKVGSNKKYYIKNPSKSVLCSSNDILMTRTGNTGMVVTNVEGAFHNNFFKISYPEYINKYFLYYFLKLDKTQNLILKLAGTSTIPDLNHSDFYKIRMTYPTLPEQQKIASFLTAVDDKIKLLSRKKALLEQYKKGMIQKIFNQEIRFKDENGQDYPDWEEKNLGGISNEIKRKLDKKKAPSELDVLTISSNTGFVLQKERFSQVIAGNSLVKYIVLKKGELSYNRGASKKFRYGCIFPLQHLEVALVPNIYISFSLNENHNYIFFSQLFTTRFADKQLRKFISSSVRLDGLLNINKDDFFSIKVPSPSLKEQNKIANFLSSIDGKINSVNDQITKTQVYKKGLLQKMFV